MLKTIIDNLVTEHPQNIATSFAYQESYACGGKHTNAYIVDNLRRRKHKKERIA